MDAVITTKKLALEPKPLDIGRFDLTYKNI